MNWKLHFHALATLALVACSGTALRAQDCQNTIQTPNTTITPNVLGGLTSISSCVHFGDYSVVGPVIPSGAYQFKVNPTGYITIREGAVDGPVIAQGVSPVTAIASANGNLYAHWNANAACGTSGVCKNATVQFMVTCTPPAVTVVPVDDCPNNQYSLNVNVTSLGDGTSVDLNYSVNGGTGQSTPGVGLGTTTIGPFTVGQTVDLTVAHSDDPMCNKYFFGLQSGNTCPYILECGGEPLDQTYCYVNNDNNHWRYQCDCGSAVIVVFSAGSIESATYDHIRFYDGLDNTGPLLYQNPTGGATNLAGLQVVAPSGNLYMEVTSEGSGSCASGGYTPWAWQAGCLDCSPPAATYAIVNDCANMEYSVNVNITNLGSDPVVDITNNNGGLPQVATATGTYTVGPFPAGSSTVVTLENDVNPLCNVNSGPMVNPLCPTVITCGGAPLAETYCYPNNDTHTWHWQSSGSEPLAMFFSAGTIESAQFDHLRIYDGPDNTSPLLFQHTQFSQLNMAGMLVISTGSHIYMESSSDGSSSCGSSTQTAWAWTIGCLDCTNPGATFSVVEDCIHHSFSVAVNVDSLGSGAFARIANTLSTDTLTNIPTGITMVGPFPMDSTVTLTVMNETNNLCRIFSPQLTSPSVACVDTVCAATAYEYCYTNSDTAWFAYQGQPGIPLTASFLWGNLGPSDFVQIYNGLLPLPANLRWQGNMNGNMAGLSINTTAGYSTMLVRVASNAQYSCATGEMALPLHWVVGCGAVGVEEADAGASTFTMYPNPTTGELSIQMPAAATGTVDMRVADLTGRTVHQEVFTASGAVSMFDLKDLQSGNYVVTLTTPAMVMAKTLQIMR